MDIMQKAKEMHKEAQGKMEIVAKVPVQDTYDLSLAYSPGVAQPCIEIENNPQAVYDYTIKGNLVGIVTDGTAVLGLGDITRSGITGDGGKGDFAKTFCQCGCISYLSRNKRCG